MKNPTWDVIWALRLAAQAHACQKYGDDPYIVHLCDVADVLCEFGYDQPDLITAAILHDIIEDTPVTRDDIAMKFNDNVADIVWGVTDEPRGGTRKQRHAATYPKIASDIRFILVKLADRIANVRASKGKPIREMYLKEYPEFRAALFTESSDMWRVLDSLCEFKPDPNTV